MSRDGNMHGSGMSHATTAFPRPSFRASWWDFDTLDLECGQHCGRQEMLDGQQQRVDIPVHARTVHNGLLQKRLEEDLC